ncbi:hypothetical protein GQ472_03385 [archaeon]|nr:hypothetical protein [archaeon]
MKNLFNMKKEMFLVLLVELVILSSFAYGFDISTPSDAQVTDLPSVGLDWDWDWDLVGLLEWTYELIADFFGIPMEDMKIRGGYLFAFVLVPILLAYMMFYAIIVKLGLFDATPSVEKWIPLLLALILAPLGIYRRFFFVVTAFMTTGTATLLYIFLFVALLGWGLKSMFFRGVGDAYSGAAYVSDMRAAKKDMGSVRNDINNYTKKIANLNSQLSGLTKEEEDGPKAAAIKKEIDELKKQRENLMEYQNSRRDDVHSAFRSIIHPNR